MVNYACAFSQSESEKYYEWIINYVKDFETIKKIKFRFNFTCENFIIFQHDHIRENVWKLLKLGLISGYIQLDAYPGD